jgi:Ni/Co efflux regulator RcnB
MKRLLFAATVAAAVSGPIAASAQQVIYDRWGNRQLDYNGNGVYDDYDRRMEENRSSSGRHYRSEDRYARYWQRGDYLPQRVLRNNQLYDWRRYDLRPPADQNNAWYIVGDQYVMANINNGLVAMTVPRQ